MAVTAEFGLLGPLVVRVDDAPMPVQTGKLRALLAALLLRANHTVPFGELADALWVEPPAAARIGVQNHAMRLRKTLGPAGSRIVTEPGGYLIRVEPGELDLDRLDTLLRDAHTAARESRWQQAAEQAASALALWRGEPLADLGSDLLMAREGPRLAELRLRAQELRIHADLQLGRDSEMIGELRELTAAHPLRERLHGLLMLALYRDGRQAEALAAYQRARKVLISELGAEPGPDLQQLHQQILTADADLARPDASRQGPASAQPVPRELPGDVAAFTGRAAELAELDELLLRSGDQAGDAKATAAVISALSGTAGVGKTALAVHWAHHAADSFPDGQLYVNLRGYDPDRPMPVADALAAFLRSLGLAGQDIPADEAQRAARYRSLLAGKKTLVVLDNAGTAEQVRPLLPGHAACAVVVTSRDALAGLVARDGARRLDLDVLPRTDAVALLRELIGARVEADPAAASALAEQCARLPLALRIAAELAASHDVPLGDVVAEIDDHRRRLDVFEADGDPRSTVRTVFSWSYYHLDHDAARAFRLTGLHPGADFDAYALAALTDTGLDDAVRLLATLTRAHLIQPTSPGRYGAHDLLRAYARELAAEHEGEQGSRDALGGLFDYYLSAAAAAMNVLLPAEAGLRPQILPAAAPIPAMPGEADARTWLDRERANLVAVVVHSSGHGWLQHATSMADTLLRYLIIGSHLAEAQTTYTHALHAARESGDTAAEARALNGLGGIGIKNGHFRDAAAHYQAALERYRQCGDIYGQARVLNNLGITHAGQHNPRSAADYFSQAVAAFENAEDGLRAASALANLAVAEADLGDYDLSAQHLQRALQVVRGANDQVGEGEVLTRVGALNVRRGQFGPAADAYTAALAIYRHLDLPTGVAIGTFGLGHVKVRQGEYGQAIDYLRQALTLHRKAGYQQGEIETLRCLAEAEAGLGRPAAGRAALAEAIRLAAETGNAYEQASALRELAESHHAAGEHGRAREHWQQALTLYADTDEEADDVRARLAALDGEQGAGA
jgi:DNA-binding SARP family transcriptional activator/Tfp pilus assembly protein PilF